MATEQENSSVSQTLKDNRLLAVVGGVAIFAILAACGLGSFLLGSFADGRGDSSQPDDTSQESAEAQPTAFPVATSPSAGVEPVIVGVSDSGTFSVTLDIPATLDLAGQRIDIQPQNIPADGIWNPEVVDETGGVWVNGSVINYVFGLPNTSENRALLESFAPGDEIQVVTRQGVTHLFSFDGLSAVPLDDRTVFDQQSPGVTVVLVGGNTEDRMLVHGRYEVAPVEGGASSNVVQLGETAQLGDVQISPLATSYLADRPEAPPGFAFYLVDFDMQNVGLTAVDTSNYRFVLADELGNQYAQNPIAGRLGNSPPLSGFLNAGQTVAATSGYQIPGGLVSPTLTWTVIDMVTGAQVMAILPFTGGAQTGQNTTISVLDAAVTSDLNNLIITGQVTNTSAQPLVVVREDVSLRTTLGTDFLMLSSNPAFPWTVPPNQTLQFAVTFQRPLVDDTAVFTILNQGFALSGLQGSAP